MTGDRLRSALAEGVEVLLGRKTKVPAQGKRGRSSWTGVPLPTRHRPAYPGRGSRADGLARLQAIVRRSPQVLVKIPAKGRKTAKSLRAHFEYLARHGEETLIDQAGQRFSSPDALDDLCWAWKHTGPSLCDSSSRREALHIIFSMREGTDEHAVFGAVKATAEQEFDAHQWVMVQHHDEPQVHVHVCVKIEATDGWRLNPRKTDLQRWRERFAYELRERGVEAEATSRASRLQRGKLRRPWGVAQLESRGQVSHPMPASPDAGKADGWRRVEQEAASTFGRIVRELRRSADSAERLLASRLDETVAATQRRNQATARDQSPGETQTLRLTVPER